MSASVETIRDIPVIVQHMRGCSESMDFNDDYYDSGFPFDNTGRRSRDPLDDIAQRHPEFAQHLQGFPRRSQRSAPADQQNDDEFLRRRFERPFASGRFERFGFPFDRDDFEREPQRYYEAYPEYFESFQNQQPEGYQQHPPSYSQQFQPQEGQKSVSQGTQTEQEAEQEEQKVENSGQTTRGRPIQQSNTCDLTQHQPPAPDDESSNEREQRSMSAPPTDNNNKRFTSSVNIPMGVNPSDNMGAKSQSGNSGSTERVIPIHVEGRDDPVLPNQPHQHNSDSSRSQPETIFGRRPEAFSQFVHREPHRFGNDWQHSFGGFPEEEFRFSRGESPSRFAHQQQQAPPPAHQQQQAPPPRQEAKVQPQQQEPPKQQQQQPLGPIEQIQAIQKDVSTLLRQVEAFNGLPRDKNYLYLDEMLTRNLLKLDNVDTQGQDSIRSARKEAIKCIEKAISLLEAKAASNAAPKEEEKMEVEEQKPIEEKNNEEVKSEVAEGEASGKSATEEEKQQPKSDEVVENVEAQAEKEEVKVEEQKVEEEVPKDEEMKAEVEGEKKEKKKIKKKVNKEDKKQ